MNLLFLVISVSKFGHGTSSVYRFKLNDNRYVFVQTKSKFFTNNANKEPDYVLSTHSIVRYIIFSIIVYIQLQVVFF